MQRQCSAGVTAVFAITSSVFSYGKIASGFDSRRLHHLLLHGIVASRDTMQNTGFLICRILVVRFATIDYAYLLRRILRRFWIERSLPRSCAFKVCIGHVNVMPHRDSLRIA